MDISLIPIEDLLKELDKRCECCIAGYFLPDDKDNLISHFGKGKWADSIMLASLLHTQVTLNWFGELKALQKLVEEEDE